MPDWLHTGLASALGLVVAVAIFARARSGVANPTVWWLIGTATALRSLADTAWRVFDVGTPSILDAAWLLAQPLLALGFILMAKGRGHVLRLLIVLDACLAALSVAALAIVWAYHSASGFTSDRWSETAVNLAYPLCDLVIILVLLVVAGSIEWRVGRALILVAVSMGAEIVANAAFFVAEAAGTYRAGGVIDVLWLMSYLTLGWAAVVDQPHSAGLDRRRDATWLAAVALLVAIAVLVAQPFAEIPLAAAVAAAAALVLGSVRLLFSIRHLHLMVEARQEARTDELTSLANRRHIIEVLTAQLANRNNGPVSLVLVDLDRFKLVNDLLGHAAGDELLRQIGRVLSDAVPQGLVARLGGDEFAVALQGLDRAQALKVAEELHRRITVARPSRSCKAYGRAPKDLTCRFCSSRLWMHAPAKPFPPKPWCAGKRIALRCSRQRSSCTSSKNSGPFPP